VGQGRRGDCAADRDSARIGGVVCRSPTIKRVRSTSPRGLSPTTSRLACPNAPATRSINAQILILDGGRSVGHPRLVPCTRAGDPSHDTNVSSALVARGLPVLEAVTTVPLAEAEDHLSEYIAGVERTHDRVVITHHGRPTAILVSPDDLAALEETVDILTTPGAPQAIAEGLADLEASRMADNNALRGRFAAGSADLTRFASRLGPSVTFSACLPKSARPVSSSSSVLWPTTRSAWADR